MRKKKQLQLATISVFIATAGFALQATAVPVFSFTERAGFTADIGFADYANPLAAIDPNPLGDTYYSDMSWVSGLTPQSSLNLTTYSGDPLLAGVWTSITTLTHENAIIPTAANWGPQDIIGRFIITDSDGGAVDVVDDTNVTKINFVESANLGCLPPNPLGSTCDDWFTFTATATDSLFFTANDESKWMAEFQFANFNNSAVIGSSVYTAEDTSSNVDIQVRLTQVPEPATLALMGFGLGALGFVRRRKIKNEIESKFAY